MKPVDKTFLDESRRHYTDLITTGTMTNVNLDAMVEVMHEYFEPDMRLDRADVSDICAFVKRLYCRYDAYLEDNSKIIIKGKRFIPGI